MKKSLRRLQGFLGLCNHESSLFVGVIKDSRFPTRLRYVMRCNDCERLYETERRPSGVRVFCGYSIGSTGSFGFSFTDQTVGSLEKFLEYMRERKVVISTDDFQKFLIDLQKHTVKIIGVNDEYKKRLNRSEFALRDAKTKLTAMESYVENFNNEIYTEKELEVLNANNEQLTKSGLLREWLFALLKDGNVMVPLEAYKLFHLTLSTIYGYEPMRYRWEWEKKEIEGDTYYTFFNRKTRRTK